MLFMLIIKVKYWLFNYKLPLVRLAAGCQAPAGWEGPVIQDKSYKLLRPVLHAIPGLELKKLSRALIHSIFIPDLVHWRVPLCLLSIVNKLDKKNKFLFEPM